MPISRLKLRTSTSFNPLITAISLSEKPSFLASFRVSASNSRTFRRKEKSMIFLIFFKKYLSMRVISHISSIEKPRVKASATIKMRSSSASLRRSRKDWSLQPRSSGRRSPNRPISRERIDFKKAASKLRSIAITSPVAFIWVPKRRSPKINLSKGQRGTFSTT